MTRRCLIVFLFCLTLKSGILQLVPLNPCPNVFQYLLSDGMLHGRVKFTNDRSGTYRLSVNVSVAAFLGDEKNIRLHLLTSPNEIANGASLIYNIYFPDQNAIPKPTKIVFNNAVYCLSPSANLEPGGYVTNLWAETFLKITVAFMNTDLPIYPTSSTPLLTSSTPPKVDYNECGVTSVKGQHLVSNGDEVFEGQFPWIAAIMCKVENSLDYRCSGTIISKKHIITAAHCIQYGKVPLFTAQELLVVLGITSLENWRLTGTLCRVDSFKVHEDFRENSADGDLAVITLREEVRFGETVRPACLWEDNDDLDLVINLEGTISGWGTNNGNVQYSKDARSISIPIVSQAVCLKSDSGFQSITSWRTFCAGKRYSNKAPCTGDDGAGFLMLRNGRWTLRGVISIALKDNVNCDFENYSVFADVAKAKDWINQTKTSNENKKITQ